MGFFDVLKNMFSDYKKDLNQMFSDQKKHLQNLSSNGPNLLQKQISDSLKNVMERLNSLPSTTKDDYDNSLLPSQQNLINQFLYGYGDDFHCKNEQYFRFQRAMDPQKIGSIISLNKIKMKMRISGTYHPSEIYTVTLNHCDCKDFEERHLPCKHIYRLALELGIVSPEWDLSGLTPETKSWIDQLNDYQQKALLRIMNSPNSRRKTFFNYTGRVPAVLIELKFIEKQDPVIIIDENYRKHELLSMLSSSPACELSLSDKKSTIIEYIIQNEPKLALTLCKNFRKIRYSEPLLQNYDYIYRFLRERFDQ